jgi:hypothetical protein
MLCYDQRSVGQSVLVSSTQLRPKTRFLLLSVLGLLMWSTFPNKRTGLSFAVATGPRQLSCYQVQVPRDSWLYWTVDLAGVLLNNLGMDCIEKSASKNFSLVCLFIAAEICLFRSYLVMDSLFWLHYSFFQPLHHYMCNPYKIFIYRSLGASN